MVGLWPALHFEGTAAQLYCCSCSKRELCLLAGLLQKKSQEGTQTTMEATLMAQQTPAQREQVRVLTQTQHSHQHLPHPLGSQISRQALVHIPACIAAACTSHAASEQCCADLQHRAVPVTSMHACMCRGTPVQSSLATAESVSLHSTHTKSW